MLAYIPCNARIFYYSNIHTYIAEKKIANY